MTMQIRINIALVVLALGLITYGQPAAAQPEQGSVTAEYSRLNAGEGRTGEMRMFEFRTQTETRDGHVVEATITTAYEIPGLGYPPPYPWEDWTPGPVDPANSNVRFSVDGKCPKTAYACDDNGTPNDKTDDTHAHMDGDFTDIGFDSEGRYHAIECDTRSLGGACISVGEPRFFGVSMDEVDEMPPVGGFFAVVAVAPYCHLGGGDCPAFDGHWGFRVVPRFGAQVSVLTAQVSVRHMHPINGPGPVQQILTAPSHPDDINAGWDAPDGSDVYTHRNSWCEIVPGVNPDGGDYTYQIQVTGIADEVHVVTQTTPGWKDMFISTCDWSPWPFLDSDLNEDGDVNMDDLIIFRSELMKSSW